MAARPEDLQATFCATLVDEWVRCGVEHAVVCPGSRSTPLVLALAADGRIGLHVHHDERSGGFLALGLALATGEPTVVVTTSGTAAAELHAAVVEADLAGVPLLVCTADRPPELVDVGAPQAIDQTHLYGRAPRWFHAPGVADGAAVGHWRGLAGRAYAEATRGSGGPVHLNLAFREPLVGTPADLPPARVADGAAWVWRPPVQAPREPVLGLAGDLAGRRGLIVAGAASGDGAAVDAIARALGWPVLAAPQAAVWSVPGAVISVADAMLRVPGLAEELRPDVVVHLGGPLASRVVGEWVARSRATEVVAAGAGRWLDPHGTAAVVLDLAADDLLEAWMRELDALVPVDEGGWRRRWEELGEQAQRAIGTVLDAETELSEPAVARALVEALPDGATLVVSSSMPIRDVEWYVTPPGRALTVHANRGANGIDGVTSTAVGISMASGGPCALLVGDVAFLHDINGLLGAAGRGTDLVVVVVDNDGGGIFSFLPQHDSVDPAVFERVYGTPHGLDLIAVAAAYGASARTTNDIGRDVAEAIEAGGVHVLVARTDRRANLDLHRRLNDVVARALTS